MSETQRFIGVVVGVVTAVLSLIPLHPIGSSVSAQPNNNLCRIMPLGDSITFGIGSGNNDQTRGGYRLPLWKNLATDDETKGVKVDFVGSERAGGALGQNLTPKFDPDNAGFPGITPPQLLTLLKTGINPLSNQVVTTGRFLETHPADIILLHLGSNGISVDRAQEWAYNVELILTEIDTFAKEQDKEITVILAQIINVNCVKNTFPFCTASNPQSVPNITKLNSLLEGIAMNRSSDEKIKIVIVDMEKEAKLNYDEPANTQVYGAETASEPHPTGDHFADTIHPNQSGYDKMAPVWLEALKKDNLLRNCNLVRDDSTPPAPPTNMIIN